MVTYFKDPLTFPLSFPKVAFPSVTTLNLSLSPAFSLFCPNLSLPFQTLLSESLSSANTQGYFSCLLSSNWRKGIPLLRKQ